MNPKELIEHYSQPLKIFRANPDINLHGPSQVVRKDIEYSSLFTHQNDIQSVDPVKIGIVFSGGPASGGHDVLCGILDQLRSGDQLVGFCGGPKGLLEGNTKLISNSDIAQISCTGGFDFLGTDRTKISTPEQFEQVRVQVKKHHLTALIIVGGDDSNTNALYLADALYGDCLVIGIPKTIDGDLRMAPYLPISFGFHSATQHYATLVNQLIIDANATSKYWHVIKLMGRHASHVTLEVCLQSHPNACVLSEEILDYGWSLNDLIDYFSTVILERHDHGMPFGTIVFPEGILDVIPEFKALIDGHVGPINDVLESYGLIPIRPIDVQHDSHGNANFSTIQIESMILDLVKADVSKVLGAQSNVKFIEHFFGYSGRGVPPTEFDTHYSRLLGKTAYELVLSNLTGVLAAVGYMDGVVSVSGIPLYSMLTLDKERHRYVIQKKLVDVMSDDFQQYQSKKVLWRNQPQTFVRKVPVAVPLILEIGITKAKKVD